MKILEAINRLNRIAEIIERVDNRCMEVDEPVTPTLEEMTQSEMSEIYGLANFKQPEFIRRIYPAWNGAVPRATVSRITNGPNRARGKDEESDKGNGNPNASDNAANARG